MTTTTWGTRVFLMLLLAFVIMRIFYLFYLKQDDLVSVENDEKKIPNYRLNKSPVIITTTTSSTLHATNSTGLRGAVLPAINKLVEPRAPVKALNESAVRAAKARRKVSRPQQQPQPYQDWENLVPRVAVPWSQFVTMPPAVPRNKLYIRPSTLSSVTQCADSANTSRTCNEVRPPPHSAHRVHASPICCLSCGATPW